MTIQRQYYLSCNSCHIVHPSRSDDAQDLEDEAIDDGWVVDSELGTDGDNEILSTHLCSSCAV